MTEARRILLVRMDGLGDALVCVPALEGLREAIGGATFGAICSPANAGLFSRARVEHVHVVDARAVDAGVREQIRAVGYTDAIVATELPAGYALARAAGARRRVGFWHRFEKTFKSIWQYAQLTDRVYRPAAWVAQPEHEVVALYGLVERLGAHRPVPDRALDLRAWLDVGSDGVTDVGRDAFAFQVTEKLRRNGWTCDSLGELAHAALSASTFRRCVFLASSSDEGLARAVLERIPRAAIDSGRVALAPRADLSRWLGALASAGAVVTPDTGAAHAAGMLGVPVVDLFETERFAQLCRQWRPWAAPSRCLEKPALSLGAATSLGSRIGVALTELARSTGAAS